MKLSDLKQVLRPMHERPELLRLFDPIIGLIFGAALVYTSALGFAAFGVLLACAFLAFQILTKVFGVKFDFDPALFQQYARGTPN
jgi:hypothetical protein